MKIGPLSLDFRNLTPSLVRRLVALAAGWSLVVLVVAGIALTAFFRQATVSQFDDQLEDSIKGLYGEATVDDKGMVYAPPMTDVRASQLYSGHYWEIAEPDGKGGLTALARSRSLWDSRMTPPPQGLAGLQAKAGVTLFYDIRGPLNEPLRAGAQLVRMPGRTAPVVFMAADDRSSIEKNARRFALTTAITLLALGAGILAAVFVQVRIGLRPLFALQREVASVRKGRAERLVGVYPVELDPLAHELNALMEHNQEVVERQRTHVGNLAHALKTPISVMLTESEQRPGPLAEVVGRQAQVMREQVDHHLRRARAAARSQSQGERTPVEPVLDELARTLERIFRDKDLVVDWRADDDLCFQGERQDLLELAGNVMENAAKFGKSKVRAFAAEAGPDWFTLTVEDDGAGMPAERHAEVLQRGARLDESAPGSGLGLSIVDELARAYRGELTLDHSLLGGLKVVLRLPRVEN
ncbi:MAG: integral rane sensor signal transduction histidine kinase [Caulobacter sp.]|nr:integral rane sensor signal transduction histidine kinase [Caulobacter sp.]